MELRRHRVRHVFGRADGVVGQAGRRVGIAGEGIARLVRGRSENSLAIVVAFVDRTYSLGDALKKGNPWWMWAGGLLGATLVMCNAYLSAHIGTGMTVMLVLLGQVGGGLLVDRFGLLGVPRKPVAGIQYVGVLVAIVGIVLKAM